MKKQPYFRRVTATVGEKHYQGEYEVSGRPSIITVRCDYGTKQTQLGGMEAEVLAKQLIRELIRTGKRD
jgi:hypothetical protein